MKKRDSSKGPKQEKGQIKEKNDKPSSINCAATTGVKKSKDGKDMETTSALPIGSSASNSRPKEPLSHATKSRSSNGKEVSGINSKPAPAKVYVWVPQVNIDLALFLFPSLVHIFVMQTYTIIFFFWCLTTICY